MELTAPILAQSIRFGSPSGNQKGIFLPNLVKRLRDEFKFVETPSRAEDYNLESGMTLKYGSFDGFLINSFKLYRSGMFVEGVCRTEPLDSMLDRIEALLRSEFSTTITPAVPVARVYSSQIEVTAVPGIQTGLEVLQAVRDQMTKAVRAYGIGVQDYQVGSFSLTSDPLKSATEAKPQRFLFERRANRPFEQNVYFSEAPLQTS